jgi:hypothetical protein
MTGNIALRAYLGDRGRGDVAGKAIEYYRRALLNSAKHHSYGPYQLSNFLDQLDARLKSVQDNQWIEFRRKLGSTLYCPRPTYLTVIELVSAE